ncbi:hypothetical protein CS371_14585 (plasmid) [Serratia marcescens]|nr:hypothetical protein EDY99_04755 [Serratia sp. LS-1]PHY80837.1 hypothetical protein CS371_14585 [Serratia marcescens]
MLSTYGTFGNIRVMPVLFALLMTLPIVVFPFSPLLGYYISIILLLTVSDLCNAKPIRVYFSLIALVCGVLVSASRVHLTSASDDFGHYYASYLSILHGGTIFQYAGGVEFLLSLYFKILVMIFGNLHPSSILFFVALLNSFLFYLWLEKFGLNRVDDKLKSLCIAASLTFYMFTISTLLMRQMLATPFLLFALSYTLRSKMGILSLLLASFAHLSSIPIYFIIRILMSEDRKKKNLMVLFFLVVLVLFSLLVKFSSSFTGLPVIGILAFKLEYYGRVSLFSFDRIDSYVKYLVVMLIASIFFFSEKHKDWKSLLYYGGAIYIIWLPIPLMSGRIFLMLGTVALGYIIFLSAYRMSIVLRYFLVIYCVFRVLTLGIYYTNNNDGFDLWYSYPWISENAFYFVR